jgi:hypothetical protein
MIDENDMRKMDKEERLMASYYSIDHPINAPYYNHWKKPTPEFLDKLNRAMDIVHLELQQYRKQRGKK